MFAIKLIMIEESVSGISSAGKKKPSKRYEKAGQTVDEPGPFGYFHKTAPHCHDAGKAQDKFNCFVCTFGKGASDSFDIARKYGIYHRYQQDNGPYIVHHGVTPFMVIKGYAVIPKRC